MGVCLADVSAAEEEESFRTDGKVRCEELISLAAL